MFVNGMTFENSRFPAGNDETLFANFCLVLGAINRENIPIPASVRNPLPVPEGLTSVCIDAMYPQHHVDATV
jgi:hypothetical protein